MGTEETRLLPGPFNGTVFPHWSRLGGWLAAGLNWHFALMWPFVVGGLVYVSYLAFSGEWRSLLFRPRDIRGAVEMQKYYLGLRKEHPPQGKHNPLQKLAYTFILVLGALSVITGFSIYKATQLSWLTSLFGGYQAARYWHFWAVWIFVGFTLAHVTLVFLVDPHSLRAVVTAVRTGEVPRAMHWSARSFSRTAGVSAASLVAACGWDGGRISEALPPVSLTPSMIGSASTCSARRAARGLPT